MKGGWLPDRGRSLGTGPIRTSDLRAWAARIEELRPEQLRWFADQVMAHSRILDLKIREVEMRIHDNRQLEWQLGQANLKLQNLATDGALPSAPPPGPSAGGGDS